MEEAKDLRIQSSQKGIKFAKALEYFFGWSEELDFKGSLELFYETLEDKRYCEKDDNKLFLNLIGFVKKIWLKNC